MRKLAEFVMRGRLQAVSMAMLFTFIPLFGWVGTAIMALVTLRISVLEGFMILLWISLPSIVVAFLGHPAGLFFDVLGTGALTWVLAVVLRYTLSWQRVLQIGTVIAITAIIAVYLLSPDIFAWWEKAFRLSAQRLQDLAPMAAGGYDKNALFWAERLISGMLAVMLLAGCLFNLGIARWWQALLDNPGGLSKELYQLNAGKLSIILLLAESLFIQSGSIIAWNLLPVVLLPFVLGGVALVHVLIKVYAKNNKAWLVAFYGMLILFFPYVIAVLIVMAVIDGFIDFRTRLNWSK